MGSVLSPQGSRPGEVGSMWAEPATPHADDDEFAGDLSDWSCTGTLSGTIDPYSAPAAPNVRFNVNDRPSWAWLQAPADGVSYRLHKSLTVATDMWIWIRGTFGVRYQGASGASTPDNDSTLALQLSTTSAGIPAVTTDSVGVYINDVDGGPTYGVQFSEFEATVFTDVRTTATPLAGQVIEAVGIHKLGTTYHGWAFTSAGHALHLGSTAHGATFDRVSIEVRNSSAASPGAMVVGVDFFRRKDSALFLPNYMEP